MEILEIILYLLAYTLGVITLFIEFICYRKNIEYLETILLTAAFLFFIVALSISLFFGSPNIDSQLNNLVLFSMILIGLTTPLNTFAERRVKIPKLVKILLYSTVGLLLILLALKVIDKFDFHTQTVISLFLGFSVFASMLLIRNTKPEKRILHREKSERIISLMLIILVPLAIFFEFIAPKILGIEIPSSKISITPPLLFIILALSKLLDDINRLSLFTNDNKLEEQNAKNFQLTSRETEIAELLIKGQSYANISEALFIAMPTVKTHVSNIYKKVKVNNKIELLNALKS